MSHLIIPLYIICGWFGRCPHPPLPPTPSPAAQATAESPASPDTALWGIGQLWSGITDKDTGWCEGYGMPTGNGARPSLVFPVPGGVLNERRGFSLTHSGLDIVAPEGATVVAPAGGTVIWSGWSTWGGGNVVAISHGGGWYSLLFHLAAVSVECGQGVTAGQVVGSVGSSGAANYFHTHYEIRNGAYSYDPGW